MEESRTFWQKANAPGTRAERSLVINDPTAATPFSSAAAGDFRLCRDFAGDPPGFAWSDVDQIGTADLANGPPPQTELAREGGVIPFEERAQRTRFGPAGGARSSLFGAAPKRPVRF